MCLFCPQRVTCRQICPQLETELSAVTRPLNYREILLPNEILKHLYTHRTLFSLAALQGAYVIPPLELVLTLLTPAQQTVILLRYRQNLSERQIAAQLNVSGIAVHKRLKLARKKIRKFINRGLAKREE